MTPFDKTEGSNWVKPPKVGDIADYASHGKIELIEKIESNKGFNFIRREKIVAPDGSEGTIEKNLGYHYEIVFEDGTRMSISNWALYYALTRAEVIEGDSIRIDHKAKGEWIITKI